MITIGMNPTLFSMGSFLLTWHGFFSFVGVILAVYLIGRWAKTYPGVDPDMVYSTAVWAIIGGIVGARLVHVVDHWSFYSADPVKIFAIWTGGIGILGAILGGFGAGALYAYLNKFPVGKLADLTSPALLLSQAIGRIGDIINGEHCATATSMPWGFVYTHPDSPAFSCFANLRDATPPTHPAVLYEMIWDLLAMVVVWKLLGKLRPDGMVFTLYLTIYAVGRFFISFFRTDKVWFLGLQEAQIITVLILMVTVPLLAYKAQLVAKQATDRN